jgi:nitrile hydratase
MARINDVGGMQGFGPIDTTDDGEPFHADWEARVFGLNSTLVRQGVYNLDEFRDAIENLPPELYLKSSYYERWYHGICALLQRKGIVSAGELDG